MWPNFHVLPWAVRLIHPPTTSSTYGTRGAPGVLDASSAARWAAGMMGRASGAELLSNPLPSAGTRSSDCRWRHIKHSIVAQFNTHEDLANDDINIEDVAS